MKKNTCLLQKKNRQLLLQKNEAYNSRFCLLLGKYIAKCKSAQLCEEKEGRKKRKRAVKQGDMTRSKKKGFFFVLMLRYGGEAIIHTRIEQPGKGKRKGK